MTTLFSSDEMNELELQNQDKAQDNSLNGSSDNITQAQKQLQGGQGKLSMAHNKLPKGIAEFTDLTEFELKVLALKAFLGRYKDSGKFKILAKHHNLMMQDINDIGYKLCKLGYLHYEWGGRGSFNTYELRQRYLFPIILFVIDHHPEWIPEFKTIARQDEETADIWNVLQMVYDEDIDGLHQHKEFKQRYYLMTLGDWIDFKYFDALLPYRFFAPYSIVLPADKLKQAIDRCMQVDYVCDEVSLEHLQTYEHCVELKFANKNIPQGHIDWKYKEILLNMLCEYRFILSGELRLENLTMLTTEVIAARAVKFLYEGKIKEANELFEKALKVHNENSKDKNLLYNPIMSYYLLMCYSKTELNEALRKKVAAFAKRKYVADNPDLQGAAFVAHHLILQDRAAMRKDDLKDLKSIKFPINNQFYQLFAAMFADDTGCKPIKDLKPASSALLRYEQSAFMQIADAEQIGALLGGKPLLKDSEHKAAWQVVFEELIGKKDDTAPANDNARQDRVAYVGDGFTWVPQRQRWLKSGRWSSPSQMGMKPFLRCEVDCMSETDKELALSLHKYNSYWENELFTTERIFPFLIGKDCVYYQRFPSEPLQQVEIRDEKPYITIERGKTGFIINSNVGIVTGRSMVRKQDDTHYSVFRFSDYEYNAFQRLLSLVNVPFSAEEMLKKYLTELSRNIEIHSPLIDGGSSLEQIEASSQIILRLHPNDEQFVLQVLVQPLAGGNLELAPATGNAIVYAAKDGQRYQVNRNLKQEKESLLELTEQLNANLNTSLEDNYAALDLEQTLLLLEFAAAHKEHFAVEWLQDYKINLRTYPVEQEGQIRLASKENWLEIEGELRLNEQEVMSYAELLRLMSEGRIGGRFVRLDNGDFLALSEQISKHLSKLEQLTQYDRKKAHIPIYQVGSIARMLQQNSKNIVADQSLKKFIKRVEEAAETDFALPKGLRTELRDYQQYGYQWIMRLAAWGANGCLADDMGLGKTIQAMTFMLQKAADGPSLVVAPASVVFNWEQELQRFAPALHPVILNDADDRTKTINALQPYDILLTTYGLLVREQEMLEKQNWNIICLDEAHTIKNRQTKMSQAAMSLQSAHRLMLTGTPIQNNLSELWNLFQFLNPGLLGSYEQFTKRFIQPIEQQKNKQQQQVLHRLVQPFILRRTKAEVIDELPDKVEITRRITLSDTERVHYEALRLNAQKEVEKAERVDVKLLTMITRLRQAACSPELVNPEWTEGSQKIEELMSLLSQIVEGGNTVLVFSQFTSFLKLVEKRLNSQHVSHLYLDGSTPLSKRKQMVEQFQRGEAQVFLISLKAGGLGLNLTAANYVIHLDPWWNPAIEQQATDRAYRIGQHQNVTVYHLIAADTIEEKILRLHKTKRDLADALLQDQNTAHTLTLDDLRMLVTEE